MRLTFKGISQPASPLPSPKATTVNSFEHPLGNICVYINIYNLFYPQMVSYFIFRSICCSFQIMYFLENFHISSQSYVDLFDPGFCFCFCFTTVYYPLSGCVMITLTDPYQWTCRLVSFFCYYRKCTVTVFVNTYLNITYSNQEITSEESFSFIL